MNQSSQPLITTIIPTYRRPQLLRRAIQSVLDQTYPGFQVCVYDNASGDETAAVVAELAACDARVQYYCHPTNIGPLPNFQFGLEQVTTPFFSFLSDDDRLLPTFYQTALSGFDKHPNAMFSATRVLSMDRADNLLGFTILKPGLHTPPEGMLTMLRDEHPTWTGVLFRREVLHEVNGLDITAEWLTDLDFELRIASMYPYIFSEEPGAVFYIDTSSYSGSLASRYQNIWPACDSIYQNLTQHRHLSESARKQAGEALLSWIIKRLAHIAIVAILRGEFEQAIQTAAIIGRYYRREDMALSLFTSARLCDAFPAIIKLSVELNELRKQVRGQWWMSINRFWAHK